MASPVGHGTVVVFTGVWQERLQDKDNETKRARRVTRKALEEKRRQAWRCSAKIS